MQEALLWNDLGCYSARSTKKLIINVVIIIISIIIAIITVITIIIKSKTFGI